MELFSFLSGSEDKSRKEEEKEKEKEKEEKGRRRKQETAASLEAQLNLQQELADAFHRSALFLHLNAAFRRLLEEAGDRGGEREERGERGGERGKKVRGAGILDEHHPAVRHFLFSLELLLAHGVGERGWFGGIGGIGGIGGKGGRGGAGLAGLWEVLEGFPPLVQRSQLPLARAFNYSINHFEDQPNPAHKVRAWIRKALMERCLADFLKIMSLNPEFLASLPFPLFFFPFFLSSLLLFSSLLFSSLLFSSLLFSCPFNRSFNPSSEYYENYAAVRSEEFGVLAGTLQGLNAINFSFVFKDADYDLTMTDISNFISTFSHMYFLFCSIPFSPASELLYIADTCTKGPETRVMQDPKKHNKEQSPPSPKATSLKKLKETKAPSQRLSSKILTLRR